MNIKCHQFIVHHSSQQLTPIQRKISKCLFGFHNSERDSGMAFWHVPPYNSHWLSLRRIIWMWYLSLLSIIQVGLLSGPRPTWGRRPREKGCFSDIERCWKEKSPCSLDSSLWSQQQCSVIELHYDVTSWFLWLSEFAWFSLLSSWISHPWGYVLGTAMSRGPGLSTHSFILPEQLWKSLVLSPNISVLCLPSTW